MKGKRSRERLRARIGTITWQSRLVALVHILSLKSSPRRRKMYTHTCGERESRKREVIRLFLMSSANVCQRPERDKKIVTIARTVTCHEMFHPMWENNLAGNGRKRYPGPNTCMGDRWCLRALK